MTRAPVAPSSSPPHATKLDNPLDLGTGCIFYVDTRPLERDFSKAPYASLNAAAGYLYAKAQGYDFKYYYPPPLNLTRLAAMEGGAAGVKEVQAQLSKGPKDGPALWHPLLKQARAAPWFKLMPAWALARAGAYEWVLFLDSDAFVRNASMRLREFVASRSSARPEAAVAGRGSYGEAPEAASLIMYPNKPWCCEGMPMTSVLLLAGTGARRRRRRWRGGTTPTPKSSTSSTRTRCV